MEQQLEALRKGLDGRYLIDREIGRGGMASVLLAQDLRYGRPVAIKVLHREVAAVIGPDRFRREILVTAQLLHPGILGVLDSGECAGPDGRTVLWYAMPFVEGASLRDRLNREHQLPVDDVIAIVREVAEALDFAHRRGIIHRDVKPENILFQDGHALLADFGIARAIDQQSQQRLTSTGFAVGTPAYMSPEQAMADPVDARSDIYSLGCVLYETLAGEPPFTGPTAQAIVARMLTELPRSITPTRPQAAALEPVVLKALARAPVDRFATARELATALSRAGSTPSAAPVASASRRPGWWVLGAAGIVAAAAVLWLAGGRDHTEPHAVARIAVLPFRTTGDSARAYFTVGMTGALRSKLATVPGIEVIAATSAEAVADMADAAAAARELGASYGLTGSVAWDSVDGGRIRVQPKLVAAADGRVVLAWPSPLIASTRDVLDVERQITEQIAQALNITVGSAVRSRLSAQAGHNSAAYELLLQADQTPSRNGRREVLKRALLLDSMLGQAWASLAQDAVIHFRNFGDIADIEAARNFSLKALAAAPDLAESHVAIGIYHRTITLEHDSAIAHLRRAEELAPGDAGTPTFLASALLSAGRLDEALVEARRAAALDPKNASALSRVPLVLLWQRKPSEARENYEALVTRLDPAAIGLPPRFFGQLAWIAEGDIGQARALLTDLDPEARLRSASFEFVSEMTPQLIDDTLVTRVCREGSAQAWFGEAPWGRHLSCAESARRSGRWMAMRAAADSAVRQLRSALRGRLNNHTTGQRLAWALLMAGDTAGALATADSALALRRIGRDAYIGASNTLEYAQIAALAGDAGRAVSALEELLANPSPVTPAWLRVDPTYDRIRSDPRFQTLIRP